MRAFTLAVLITGIGNQITHALSIEELYKMAYLQKEQDNIKQAIEKYHEVLALAPEHAMAHLGLAQCYLTLGEFDRGWPHFEYRGSEIRSFTHYDWRTADLTGKRILLRTEWGLGDCIQFVRYAQLIKKRGGIVYVQTYKELVPLFRLCPFIDRVIPVGDQFPEYDIQIPLLSLPSIFGTTLETIPNETPYLYADQTLIDRWEKKIDQTKYNIGICWSGGGKKNAPSFLNKNMSPLDFESLSDMPNVQLYALQKVSPEDPAHAFCFVLNIETFDDDFDTTHGSFMDTAALMHHLDLIISIDTSVAHLAGALGKQVCILLPFKADWRWMQKKTKSPWYPTALLLQQPEPGNFKLLITKIKKKIKMHT